MKVLWRRERDESLAGILSSSGVIQSSYFSAFKHRQGLAWEVNLETGEPLNVHSLPQGSRMCRCKTKRFGILW